MKDSIEFYDESGDWITASYSSVRFSKGDLVNIRKKTYRVTRVTLAVDHPEIGARGFVRQNVDLKEVKHAR